MGVALSGWVRAGCPGDLLSAALLWAVATGVDRGGLRLLAMHLGLASSRAEADHKYGKPTFTTTAAVNVDSDDFAAVQFAASYRFVVGIVVVLMVFVVIFTWNEQHPFRHNAGFACLVTGAFAILTRTHLYRMRDQEQARIYFGRAVVALEILRQMGMYYSTSAFAQNAAPALYLTSRLMAFLYQAFAGYSALNWQHRLATAVVFFVCSWMRPPLSTIGKRYESIITAFCLTAGVTFGGALEAALTRRRGLS